MNETDPLGLLRKSSSSVISPGTSYSSLPTPLPDDLFVLRYLFSHLQTSTYRIDYQVFLTSSGMDSVLPRPSVRLIIQSTFDMASRTHSKFLFKLIGPVVKSGRIVPVPLTKDVGPPNDPQFLPSPLIPSS